MPELLPPFDKEEYLIRSLTEFSQKSGQVIERYKNFKWAIVRKNIFEMDEDKIIDSSFLGRMIKSFPGEHPHRTYEEWLDEPNRLEEIKQISLITQNQTLYDEKIYALGDLLSNKFGNESLKGKSMKIINLIMKHLFYKHQIEDIKRVNIQPFLLHVPWDKFTLIPLRKIFHPPEGYAHISTSSTMGFVTDMKLYLSLHEYISRICERAEVPRIYYEFMCWDGPHQGE